jgi:hypothetical protein
MLFDQCLALGVTYLTGFQYAWGFYTLADRFPVFLAQIMFRPAPPIGFSE